jgi:hypothetical protein
MCICEYMYATDFFALIKCHKNQTNAYLFIYETVILRLVKSTTCFVIESKEFLKH